MWNRGKLVILLILTVGIVAGLFAWRAHFQRGIRVLQLWNADTTFRIRMAPECELLRLTPATGEGNRENLEIGGQTLSVTDRRDISQARGLVHARQALIHDASYVWESSGSENPQWTTALVFRDPQQPAQATTLLIDLAQGNICDASTGRSADITPIVKGLKLFLDEQWATPSDS